MVILGPLGSLADVMRCAACQSEIPGANRFCGSCGAPVSTPSKLATVTATAGPGSAGAVALETPAATRILPADSGPGGALTPGTVLGGRYRVIGLLGRGGMGDVYRADDLKLGAAVALKFLPRALAEDEGRRARFLAEVRLARQVSHPNVCRVHDLAEVEGRQFLSMEYIDGEDLGSLLKRIGRLPADKVLDIARQISAGLAAAHERGVLHRDLKPANVMLDGRGRARITDFGLAVAADAPPEPGASGTPAYMAPEQLAGEGASVASDIYALGLVLYELFTGRRPFTAASLAELADLKRHESPTPPSRLIKDIDPAVERLILRAIASDPRQRPASVAEVAAALPGGSPLEAALRAGETPSPEMVAASRRNEGLAPRWAWAWLGLVVAVAALAVAVGSQAWIWRLDALEKPPEALADRARELLARLGYPGAPADRASGFETDLDHLRYLRAHEGSRTRQIPTDPSAFRFWYRESPQPLESWRYAIRYGQRSRVDAIDPPLELEGMSLVRLDPRGRLIELVVVPPTTQAAAGPASPPDWPALLAAAGYDPGAWRPAAPRRTPPYYADARAAWEGVWPGRPGLAVRLEAGAFHGRPVYFESVFPWTRPGRTGSALLDAGERAVLVLLFVLGAGVLAGAAILASRNLRTGRGDRRGAFRLASFVLGAMVVSWFFGESHVATPWEAVLVVMGVSWGLLVAAVCWLGYIALEPLVRRRWPGVLVSWACVVAGRLGDPLVGRDLLIGCAGGTLYALLAFTSTLVPEWLGLPAPIVPADIIGVAYGLQQVVPLLVWRLGYSVITGLTILFVLLLFRLALRRDRLAIAAFVLITSAIGPRDEHYWLFFGYTLVVQGLFVLLLLRVGLLATVAAFYTGGLLMLFPVTGQLSSWYAGSGVSALLTLAALAGCGFKIALGGRSALGDASPDRS